MNKEDKNYLESHKAYMELMEIQTESLIKDIDMLERESIAKHRLLDITIEGIQVSQEAFNEWREVKSEQEESI